MRTLTDQLNRPWNEPAICLITHEDGRIFATAGYSWVECGWNAILETRAYSRKAGANCALAEDQVLTLQMTVHPFRKRKVRVSDVMTWARRTGLYSELGS